MVSTTLPQVLIISGDTHSNDHTLFSTLYVLWYTNTLRRITLLVISDRNPDFPSKRLKAAVIGRERPPANVGARMGSTGSDAQSAALMTTFRKWVEAKVKWCDSLCSCTCRIDALDCTAVVTQCPASSGCFFYTSEREDDAIERWMTQHRILTYVRPNQYIQRCRLAMASAGSESAAAAAT
jgi:hypothetical protein